jgi:tRNA-dependent cyclodipeptide synthase
MKNSAFVGVSLDSAIFSREWIRGALSYLLSEHDDLLFVLADQLLAYNKTAVLADYPNRIELGSADTRIDQRRDDITKFIRKEVALLPRVDKDRVQIATWDYFSDVSYVTLLRKLRIAYSAIGNFRSCVDQDASFHFNRHWDRSENRIAHHELCVSYVLDETAMDIRITEVADHPFEYYPEDHIRTLTYLYDNRFREFGLTVPELIGKPAQRTFRPLHFSPTLQNS